MPSAESLPVSTLAILGATGRSGRRILTDALEARLVVHALARVPEALAPLAHPRLHVVRGDAERLADVAAVVDGADAAVSALGGGTTAAPGTARSAGARHLVEAFAARGAAGARVVLVAGGGILDAPEGGLRQEQPRFPAVFRLVSAEHRRAWEALRASPLAWTAVCTGDIVPGEATGAYRVLADRMPEGGRRITIPDLAAFVLDELRAGRFLRRRVGLAE